MIGERLCSTAYDDRREEQVDLIDQTSLERLCGEVGAAYGDVTLRVRFHLTDHFGIKVAHDACPGARSLLQRP